MIKKSVAEIALAVGGDVMGDAGVAIQGVSGIKEAQPGDLTFVANAKYFPLVEKTKAAVIICPRNMTASGKTLIRVDNPSLAFSKAVSLFSAEPVPRWEGIHPTAFVATDVRLGKNLSLGPYVVIEGGAIIGDNVTIGAGCFIGYQSTLGSDCTLYPHVMIRERCSIGHRCIIHSGTVIGSDGFGYIAIEGRHEKIPQVGIVEIHDDVEIGANVTVDRARFDKTVIGAGTKIDNLVQIAHNVRIGKNCLLIAQSGISGSTVLEDSVILAGQSGVAGHLAIGMGSVVAARGGVTHSVPPGTVVSGYPAQPHMEAKRINAHVQRLPHYAQIINELKRKVEELEQKISGHSSD